MFGIGFEGHPHLVTLLLPDGFEGHPLRKEFVLAARVAKAWPGAKEPGESDRGDGPARRKMQPAGVPDPNEWGPLKGTLPPVAERPARGARAARAGGAARGRGRRCAGGAGGPAAAYPQHHGRLDQPGGSCRCCARCSRCACRASGLGRAVALAGARARTRACACCSRC